MKEHSHPLFRGFRNVIVIYFFALVFILPRWLSAQSCLPSGITFTTQQQIDDFATDYPGCVDILGEVKVDGITNSEITNLDGLIQLQSIDGQLHVFSNSSLTNLSGLDNLTNIDGNLIISFNSTLSNITALENLTTINGELAIANNGALSSLEGLENVPSINGDLTIDNNDALSTLTGLENINSINGKINISSNGILNSLTGIQNIDPNSIESSSTGNDLTIFFNPLLSQCEMQSICDFLDIASTDPNLTTFIIANASGCNSQTEVETACSALPVSWEEEPTVVEKNQFNEITWSVSQQVNNDKFVIEFRSENVDFRSIGEVRGHGTTSTEERYTFEHINPTFGLNYYRVKQVDLDGNFIYSDIVSIHNSRGVDISLYPNPTRLNEIQVIAQTESKYTLHFSDGLKTKQGTLKIGKNSIDLSFYDSGIYFLRTEFDVHKIIKL